MKKLLEALDVQCIIAPQDVGTADVTGTYVDVSNAERVVLLAKAGAVTAGKILTVTPMQATDTSGTSAKALGSASTATGAGGNAPADVEIEIAASDLDAANGFKCVTVVLGIDENAKLGTAYIVKGDRRYQP